MATLSDIAIALRTSLYPFDHLPDRATHKRVAHARGVLIALLKHVEYAVDNPLTVGRLRTIANRAESSENRLLAAQAISKFAQQAASQAVDGQVELPVHLAPDVAGAVVTLAVSAQGLVQAAADHLSEELHDVQQYADRPGNMLALYDLVLPDEPEERAPNDQA